MILNKAEIQRRFEYKPPSAAQREVYQEITEACIDLAMLIVTLTPGGREQSLAITALEEVRMRANQAIATGKEWEPANPFA